MKPEDYRPHPGQSLTDDEVGMIVGLVRREKRVRRVAQLLGISKQSVYSYRLRYPDIRAAIAAVEPSAVELGRQIFEEFEKIATWRDWQQRRRLVCSRLGCSQREYVMAMKRPENVRRLRAMMQSRRQRRLDEIVEAIRLSPSVREASLRLGVTNETSIYTWAGRYPEVRAALEARETGTQGK